MIHFFKWFLFRIYSQHQWKYFFLCFALKTSCYPVRLSHLTPLLVIAKLRMRAAARSGHRYGSRPSLAAEYATCVNLLNMCCCWKASLMIFTTCLKSLVLLKELLRHCSRCQTLYILHYCTDSMKPKNLVTHCFTVSLFKCFTVL